MVEFLVDVDVTVALVTTKRNVTRQFSSISAAAEAFRRMKKAINIDEVLAIMAEEG